MRRVVFFFFFLTTFYAVSGQSVVKLPELDKSPMDMSYFPLNYPVNKISNKTTEPLIARLIYSRPQRQGRQVFGELIEYGKIWRLGANEASEIEFYKDVRIGGKKVAKGRYTIYAIPYESSWTFIVNKDTDIWGAFKYDAKKDVIRMDIPVQKLDDIVESLSMTFDKTDKGANLIIAWEQTRAVIPLQF